MEKQAGSAPIYRRGDVDAILSTIVSAAMLEVY